MLLITVLIIAFLFWRTDIFAPAQPVSGAAPSTLGNYVPAGAAPVQQDLKVIQEAQNAKQQLQGQNAAEFKAAGY